MNKKTDIKTVVRKEEREIEIIKECLMKIKNITDLR